MHFRSLSGRLYVFALMTLSTISLVCNFTIFADSLVSSYFIPIYFFLLFSFCYFTYQEVNYGVALRLQIFYIVPLLVNFALVKDHKFSEYVVYFTTFTISNVICFYEIIVRKPSLRLSKKHAIYVLIGLALLAIAVISCLFSAKATKFVIILSTLAVYVMVPRVPDRIPISSSLERYKNKKVFLYITCIVLTYAFMIFSASVGFISYLLYVISVVNLCFCFRNDKWYFCLTVVFLSMASLVPVGVFGYYIDSLLLTMIVLLFHIKSPVIYFKNTKYGFLKVEYDYKANKLVLFNDDICQGERDLNNNHYVDTIYYGHISKGPVATIFNLPVLKEKVSEIAVLGLGGGVISAFADSSHRITFYEINPEIVRIAQDERFFNYLAESKAKINITLGDARQQLQTAVSEFYNLICVDVYLGNDIPKHFLTLEMMKIYLQKLNKGGILLINITNRDKNLDNVIANMAKELNVFGYVYHHPSLRTSRVAKKGLFAHVKTNATFREYALKIAQNLFNIDLSYFMAESSEETYSWAAIAKQAESIQMLAAIPEWHRLSSICNEQEVLIYTDKGIGYRDNDEVITSEIK